MREVNGLKKVGCLKSSLEDSPGTKKCEAAMDLDFCSKRGEIQLDGSEQGIRLFN